MNFQPAKGVCILVTRTRRTLVCLMLTGLLVSGHSATQAAVSFHNDVEPVISKAGCNAGTCHGNKFGKGGFKLSLRGQDPDLDLLAFTRDNFARRVNPFEPDQSLILLKASAQLAHEGGQRFNKSSEEYETLRRWI